MRFYEQEFRTVYVLLLERARKDLWYTCSQGDMEQEVAADYLCDKHNGIISVAIFRL